MSFGWVNDSLSEPPGGRTTLPRSIIFRIGVTRVGSLEPTAFAALTIRTCRLGVALARTPSTTLSPSSFARW